MAVVEVSSLSVHAGQRPLLQQVNFVIESGDVCALIGPNGAGKTTLLNALSGEQPLSGGEVIFAGSTLSDWSQSDGLRRQRARQLALLPQFSLLSFSYKVSEVIALGRTPHSTGCARDQQIVAEVMAMMDITHLQARLYTQLSGGERQRVHIARVLAQLHRSKDESPCPRLLLLDEPVSALDLEHQQALMLSLKQLARQGLAVVMAVHDINLAARHASHVLALKQGQMLAYGSVDEVVTEQVIAQVFDVKVTCLRRSGIVGPVVIY